MEGSPTAKKPRSKIMILFWIILAFLFLTFALDALGIDVIGTRESDTMIERPHSAE